MTLLIVDSVETAPFVYPLRHGLVDANASVEICKRIVASDLGPGDAAMIASAEIARLTETHAVVPGVAIVCEGVGTIAMRVPVRPDEVELSDIRLYDVSRTAEYLARATIESFYGIRTGQWTAGDAPEAQVVVVEGPEALVPPETGFSEDLVRAWFILTGEPLVGHLLVVPRTGDSSDAIDLMNRARAAGYEHRRDMRKETAERYGVPRERLVELAAARRYAMSLNDRKALLLFLQRGNKGSSDPYVWEIPYDRERDQAASPGTD
jgi:predicted solute-binding protein